MGARKTEFRTAKPLRPRPSFDGRRQALIVVCVVWFVCIVARLYYFQVIEYVEFTSRAERQQQRTVEVAPERGAIYDRQMNPLAMSLGVQSVYAVPSEIAHPDMVAGLLASVLGVDVDDLRNHFAASHSFCWVKRRVKPDEVARVRELNLKGIYFQPETKRFYPKGDLAAPVVGYVGIDDKGLGGIEYSLDDKIKGKPGRMLLDFDARRRTFHSTEWAGVPGKNVVLSLDEKIQYIAQKALTQEVMDSHAEGGTAIVQNPYTGEILAMASVPTFDPNDVDASPASARLNRALGWVYEPGSTFKLITMSAALEEGLTNTSEYIDCQGGAMVLAGHTIHDAERLGVLSLTDVMAESSDVGVIKLALRLGDDRLYRYIRAFGMGTKTGIELPGEERGLLQPPSRWSGISIGEMAIGQEAAVTPLQMVTMYSAVANGGILFQPRIVHDVYMGSHHDALPPASGHRVLSEKTANIMRDIFTAVVDHGTGKGAQLSGYSSAGKTGTAQKVVNGTYNHSLHIGSFIGFAPVTHPAVTILVVIDSPVGAYYGAEVAAPVFRSIAEQTLDYLNVPQDNPSRWPRKEPPKPMTIPAQKPEDFMGYLPSGRESGASTSPVRPAAFSAPGMSEGPAPPHPTPEGLSSSTVVLGDGPLVTVPDFTGWAARKVALECEKRKLDLNVVGSGLAVEQNPVPGIKVPQGTAIWVRLAR